MVGRADMSATGQPEWKGRAMQPRTSRDVQFLVVHCADTPDDKDFSAEDIHKWHRQKGWDGIGYHAVICRDGTVHQGRPDYWPGAHVRGRNSISLGVCLIGRQDFSEGQLTELGLWLDEKLEMYPNAQVVGHRDLDSSKTCPNFDAGKWWSNGAPVDSLEDFR